MKLILLGAAMVAAPVSGAPTYLSCSINPNASDLVRVSLDESNQVATLTYPNGVSKKYAASFYPTTVTFGDPTSGVVGLTYTIDRTTLAFTPSTIALGDVKPMGTGKCKVTQPPKRAF